MPGPEILARDLRLRALAQLARVPVSRGGDGLVKRLAWIGSCRAGALGDRDADAAGDFTHRRRIIHAELLHEEREDVARFVADKAVEHSLLGNDREVAVRAAVKGTRPAEIGTRALQLDMFADDAHEVGGLTNLFDDVVGDHRAVGRLGGSAV